jgi:hypothetical protein
MKQMGWETIDFKSFVEFAHSHPAMLYPAFDLQDLLRKYICGEGFWDLRTFERDKMCSSQYIPLEKMIVMRKKRTVKGKIDPNNEVEYCEVEEDELKSRRNSAGRMGDEENFEHNGNTQQPVRRKSISKAGDEVHTDHNGHSQQPVRRKSISKAGDEGHIDHNGHTQQPVRRKSISKAGDEGHTDHNGHTQQPVRRKSITKVGEVDHHVEATRRKSISSNADNDHQDHHVRRNSIGKAPHQLKA